MKSVTEIGYLDAELANEGQRVDVGNENINYAPPVKPIIPDLSVVKSLRPYFKPYQFRPFPAWIYHPTESARLVSAKEAAQYGVVFRKATDEERIRYHAAPEFYDSTGEWRTEPYPKDLAFNPEKPGPGKIYVPRVVDQAKQQTALLEILARGQGGIVDNTEMEALKEQVAKMQALIEQMSGKLQPRDIQSNVEPEVTVKAHKEAMEDILDSQEWNVEETGYTDLAQQAMALGIKVDGRWGADRLKEEIEKAGG